MRTLIAAALLAAVAAPAFAQSTPQIDRRQYNQERRIEQGYRSGTLSAQEAWKLDQGQRRIDRMERRAVSDGYITPRERARIVVRHLVANLLEDLVERGGGWLA